MFEKVGTRRVKSTTKLTITVAGGGGVFGAQ